MKGKPLESLAFAVVGVLIFGYLVTQCQKVASERPVPGVTVTVKR